MAGTKTESKCVFLMMSHRRYIFSYPQCLTTPLSVSCRDVTYTPYTPSSPQHTPSSQTKGHSAAEVECNRQTLTAFSGLVCVVPLRNVKTSPCDAIGFKVQGMAYLKTKPGKEWSIILQDLYLCLKAMASRHCCVSIIRTHKLGMKQHDK